MYEKIANTIELSHEEWLKLRKKGIGGSDAGAVCGVNPFCSAISVYMDKISEEINESDSETMRQGRDLEDYVAKRFMETTGKKVRRTNYMYRNTEHPFMLADVDRLVTGEDAGLECKTASAWNEEKWRDGKIPDHYVIQCQHYMAVLGLSKWYIAVAILGRDYQWRCIERDEKLIANLITIEKDFWYSHIIPGVIPDPDGSKTYDDILQEYFKDVKKEKTIELIGFDDELRRRHELTLLQEKLEAEKNVIDQHIKLYMKDSEYAVNSRYHISWSGITKNTVDAKRLKEEEPDIYARYLKSSEYRRFTVKESA